MGPEGLFKAQVLDCDLGSEQKAAKKENARNGSQDPYAVTMGNSQSRFPEIATSCISHFCDRTGAIKYRST